MDMTRWSTTVTVLVWGEAELKPLLGLAQQFALALASALYARILGHKLQIQ